MPTHTRWIDTTFNASIIDTGQLLTSLMGAVGAEPTRFDNLTLMRTIIGMDIAYTVHDDAEGSQGVAIGIGFASTESFVAGTVPDPNTDLDFPPRGWVWRSQYRIWGFANGVADVWDRRIDIDLRGRRKLDNGIGYLVATNNNVEGTARTIRLFGIVRQLWVQT